MLRPGKTVHILRNNTINTRSLDLLFSAVILILTYQCSQASPNKKKDAPVQTENLSLIKMAKVDAGNKDSSVDHENNSNEPNTNFIFPDEYKYDHAKEQKPTPPEDSEDPLEEKDADQTEQLIGSTTYRIEYDISRLQGGRDYMEDRHKVLLRPDLKIFAVFDGHGNFKMADWLSKNLLGRLRKIIVKYQLPEDSILLSDHIKKLFSSVDMEISEKYPNSGSTAIILALYQGYFITINLGDSGAIVCSDGRGIFKTRDHKPNDKDEMERISCSNGGVVFWDKCIHRITSQHYGGGLAISRAFGDSSLKKNHKGEYNKSNPPVSVEPDIEFTKITEKSYDILLASDGFWDYVPISSIPNKLSDDNTSSKSLLEEAYFLNGISSDNITTLLIKIHT